MPHQCLSCGSLFQDGSPQLLKGCPQCGGNRFFYTKHPLDEQEREAIKKEIGKDINEQLIDLLGKHQPDIIDRSGKWITMKPKDKPYHNIFLTRMTRPIIKNDQKKTRSLIHLIKAIEMNVSHKSKIIHHLQMNQKPLELNLRENTVSM